MDVRLRSSEPKTCSSFTTTQPAGLLNTVSFGDSFGLNEGCGRPAYLFGYINGGCYQIPQTLVSLKFRSCDQNNGYFEDFFTALNCVGPALFGLLPYSSACLATPYGYNNSQQYFFSNAGPVTLAPTSPLPRGKAVLCYQASLAEYVPDTSVGQYVLSTGTGTATIVAFVASGEIELNVAFSGLSFPTAGFIILEAPSPIDENDLVITDGVPTGVISGVYSNTTSVGVNLLQDLVAGAEGASRLVLYTTGSLVYGEFSRLEPGSDQHIAHCQARSEPKNLRAVAL